MKYYIEDPDGNVVAKFDGRKRETRPDDEILEVDSVNELSKIDANWIEYYEQS